MGLGFKQTSALNASTFRLTPSESCTPERGYSQRTSPHPWVMPCLGLNLSGICVFSNSPGDLSVEAVSHLVTVVTNSVKLFCASILYNLFPKLLSIKPCQTWPALYWISCHFSLLGRRSLFQSKTSWCSFSVFMSYRNFLGAPSVIPVHCFSFELFILPGSGGSPPPCEPGLAFQIASFFCFHCTHFLQVVQFLFFLSISP